MNPRNTYTLWSDDNAFSQKSEGRSPSGNEQHPPDWVTSASRDTKICPKCGFATLSRVHRPRMMKFFLFWLPLRRYECFYCRKYIYIHNRK